MQQGIERRQVARIHEETPVEYCPYGLLVPSLEEGVFHAKGVDVSEHGRGVGFVTAYPTFTGRKIRIVRKGVAATAEVRWVAAVPEGYRVGAAVSPS